MKFQVGRGYWSENYVAWDFKNDKTNHNLWVYKMSKFLMGEKNSFRFFWTLNKASQNINKKNYISSIITWYTFHTDNKSIFGERKHSNKFLIYYYAYIYTSGNAPWSLATWRKRWGRGGRKKSTLNFYFSFKAKKISKSDFSFGGWEIVLNFSWT